MHSKALMSLSCVGCLPARSLDSNSPLLPLGRLTAIRVHIILLYNTQIKLSSVKDLRSSEVGFHVKNRTCGVSVSAINVLLLQENAFIKTIPKLRKKFQGERHLKNNIPSPLDCTLAMVALITGP